VKRERYALLMPAKEIVKVSISRVKANALYMSVF